MNRIFKETQKFNQWWLWLILFGSSVFIVIFFVKEMQEDAQIMWGMLAVFVVQALVLLIFWMIQLRTEISPEHISIHFYPFMRKTFLWPEIAHTEVVNYGFVGGWGIRFFIKYGTVFNIKGRQGLAIKLKNGKRYLVGTQKERELEEYLSALHKRNKSF